MNNEKPTRLPHEIAEATESVLGIIRGVTATEIEILRLKQVAENQHNLIGHIFLSLAQAKDLDELKTLLCQTPVDERHF